MENNKPNYHPKAAFALFLNQAEYNVKLAIEDVLGLEKNKLQVKTHISKEISDLEDTHISELEKRFFPFLKTNDSKYKDRKHQIFKITYERLLKFRNYFSHFYHTKERAFSFEIENNKLDDRELEYYLVDKFNEAKEFIENDNKNIEILERYNFFEKDKNGKTIFSDNKFAIVFIASFFLQKDQINELISQVKFLKGTQKSEFRTTRECFSFFHAHRPQSKLSSNEHYGQIFLDTISHLSKIPQIVYENLNNEKQTEIDEEKNRRTQKDKFTQFALQFIDDFDLLPNVKFKIYTGDYIKEKYKKLFDENNNDRNFTREIRETEFAKKTKPKQEYVVLNNNVYFKYQEKIGSISIYELKNIVYALIPEPETKDIFSQYIETYQINLSNISKDKIPSIENIKNNFKKFVYDYNFSIKEFPKSIQNWIKQNTAFDKKYWEQFIEKLVNTEKKGKSVDYEKEITFNIINNEALYKKIVKDEQTEDIYEIIKILNKKSDKDYNFADNIIETLQNWVRRINTKYATIDNVSYPDAFQKKNILIRLKNLQNTFEKYDSNPNKPLSKFQKITDCIKIITDFKNHSHKGKTNERYVSKLDYDTNFWYDSMQKALGNEDFERENILEHLDNNRKGDELKIYEMLESNSNINCFDKFFEQIRENYIKWTIEKQKAIETEQNSENWKDIGKFLKIKRKNNHKQRIKEIVEQHLKTIIIPRGFVSHFSKFHQKNNKKGSKVKLEIFEKIKEKEINLIQEYANFEDFDEDKISLKVFQKINELKTKDAVLLLIAQKYFEKISDNKIETDLNTILSKNGTIIIEIENKKIEFSSKNFHKINILLNDKKINKLIKFYGKDKESPLIYKDIRNLYTKLLKHQIRIVDRILVLEKQIISDYLIKKIGFSNANNKAEKLVLIKHFIDLEEKTKKFIFELNDYKVIKAKVKKHIPELLDKDDKNRVETQKLINTYNIGKKGTQQIQYKKELKPLRNAAFHNSIPENGTFKDGINLLDQHIK